MRAGQARVDRTHAAVAVRVDPSSRSRPAYTEFLPPGVLIAQRVVFGSDYEDGGACIPPSRAQSAPAEIAHHGFKVPRTRSEPFPNAAESGREIEFLTVYGGFGLSRNVVST